jgi:hypothetical protein
VCEVIVAIGIGKSKQGRRGKTALTCGVLFPHQYAFWPRPEGKYYLW